MKSASSAYIASPGRLWSAGCRLGRLRVVLGGIDTRCGVPPTTGPLVECRLSS